MTLASFSLGFFVLVSFVRIIAYVPQIVKIVRDRDGAKAVLSATWALFALSHMATALYAFIAHGDLWVAGAFVLNAAGCALVSAMAIQKRLRHRLPAALPAAAGS